METVDRVRKFITTNFYVADAAALSNDASLLDGGVMDSTGVLELVTFLEAEFGVTVADEEMLPANLESISKITAFVGRKTSKPAT